MDRQKLIEENIKLVYKVANKYRYLCCNTIDFDDLVSLGYIGLVKAADAFDESKNLKFSTLAFVCIRNSILREFVGKQYRFNSNNTVSMHNLIIDDLEAEGVFQDESADKDFERLENRLVIESIYKSATDVEKRIIELFLDGYSTKEIASRVNYHQVTVSKIIGNLKKYIGGEMYMRLDATEVECPYCQGRLGDDIDGKTHIKYCLDCGKWWETYTEEEN